MTAKSGSTMKTIEALMDSLKTEKSVYIQPHDYPDHDAVVSAFGLQHFFKCHGIASRIVYDMDIQRNSLKTMIRDLNIDIKPADTYTMNALDKIVLVDGCKGNKNVKDLIGDEVGIIDHHLSKCPRDIQYADIRTEYGACATIIASYFFESGLVMPRAVATALMIGISLDTCYLTRGVCEQDLKAYWQCSSLADMDYVNSILRNNIQINDLAHYRFLLNHMECIGQLAFCYFSRGCDQNLMGILGDFLLSLDKVDFVVLCAKNDNRVNFSLRSESPEWAADVMARQILDGIGFGGGHTEMAGGVVRDVSLFDREAILARTLTALDMNNAQP